MLLKSKIQEYDNDTLKRMYKRIKAKYDKPSDSINAKNVTIEMHNRNLI